MNALDDFLYTITLDNIIFASPQPENLCSIYTGKWSVFYEQLACVGNRAYSGHRVANIYHTFETGHTYIIDTSIYPFLFFDIYGCADVYICKQTEEAGNEGRCLHNSPTYHNCTFCETNHIVWMKLDYNWNCALGKRIRKCINGKMKFKKNFLVSKTE